MTRSTDFSITVSRGARSAQPDLVVHAHRSVSDVPDDPKIGFVVSKSVGSAVQRHRVSRVLRHVSRGVLHELEPGEKVVVRALPGSRLAASARLDHELRTALRRARSGTSR